MQNLQRIKLFTISTLLILFVGATQFNYGGISLLDAAKNSFECSSLSLFILACLFYTILIAIPYVPGLELGLLLMVSYGKAGIFAAYLCTFIGLNIAFAAGRLSSNYWANSVKKKQHDNNQGTTERPNVIEVMSSWQTVILKNRFLTHRAKLFLEHKIKRYKYWSIALLLNLPGNWIIGGGGGISFLSGCHHSNSWPKFAVTVALATSILPIFFYLGLLSVESLYW